METLATPKPKDDLGHEDFSGLDVGDGGLERLKVSVVPEGDRSRKPIEF
jgi:hypothetical protein